MEQKMQTIPEGAKQEKVTDTLSVLQKSGVFSYGTDAVLLGAYAASFIPENAGRRVMDLCSGTGIIGLLLADKRKRISVLGVEINEEAAALSEKSAEISDLSERYSVTCADLKNCRSLFEPDTVDYVTVNPPYMSADCGYLCESDYKSVARHEILCKLTDVFAAAFYVLKSGGSLFVVYRPERLSTLFAAARKNHFEVKHMTFVHTRAGSESKLVLCECKKNGREGLIITKPLVLYRDNGEYTDDYLKVREKGEIDLG